LGCYGRSKQPLRKRGKKNPKNQEPQREKEKGDPSGQPILPRLKAFLKKEKGGSGFLKKKEGKRAFRPSTMSARRTTDEGKERMVQIRTFHPEERQNGAARKGRPCVPGHWVSTFYSQEGGKGTRGNRERQKKKKSGRSLLLATIRRKNISRQKRKGGKEAEERGPLQLHRGEEKKNLPTVKGKKEPDSPCVPWENLFFSARRGKKGERRERAEPVKKKKGRCIGFEGTCENTHDRAERRKTQRRGKGYSH